MTDGNADEVDLSPIASERGHQGVVLLDFFLELLVAAEVPAKADLEEDKGAALSVEGVVVRGRVGRHSSGVDDVGGSPSPAVIKMSRSSYSSTHAGMHRGAFVSSSLCIEATPCEGRVFVSMDTWTRRLLCGVGAVCGVRLANMCWLGVFVWLGLAHLGWER